MHRLLLALTLFATSLAAHAQARFQEGVHYQRIETPIAVSPPAGKVDVVEVFSYGCHFCNDTEPYFLAWLETPSAKRAAVSHLPATFNDLFALVARGFYAAEALGARERTHQKIFDTFFVEKRQVRSLNDLADVYSQYDMDHAEFLAAATSFGVEANLRKAEAYQRRAQIDAVPTFVVAGKYRVTPRAGGGNVELFQVVDFLIAQELAAATPKAD